MKQKSFNIKTLKELSKKDCFICKNQVLKHNIVYEDKSFIAFLDSYSPTKGYTILATKRHYSDISQIPQKEYLKMQKLTHRISCSLNKIFKPKRVVLLNTGALLSHYHFHIIPMYKPLKDNLIDVILKKYIINMSVDERKAIAQRIRENL